MKKLFTIIVVSTIMSTSLMAQTQLPNAGFENWVTETYEGITYENPEGDWVSEVCASVEGEASCETAANKSTEAYNGEYAVNLTTDAAGLLLLNGYSFSDRPDGIRFHAKPSLVGSDSLSVAVYLHTESSVIDSAITHITENQTAYTAYTADFAGSGGESYQYISVLISITSDESTSTALIDDFELTYGTAGLFDHKTGKGHKNYIAPNPADDQLFLDEEIVSYKISNAMGQVVLAGDDQVADVSDLQAGLYTILLRNKQGEYAVNKFVKQ